MKKVIFLDIDGVLNVEVFINAFWYICKQLELNRPDASKLRQTVLRDDYGNLFCPTACNMLAWIIKETNADIVISSTWRHAGVYKMQEMWKHRKLAGNIIDITPIYIDEKDRDLSFKERKERGQEIDIWLNHNKVDNYCIVDDDDDMLESQMNNFVQVDGMYGLTNEHALKVIEILNK